jgi:hypothetical protein
MGHSSLGNYVLLFGVWGEWGWGHVSKLAAD